MIYLDYSATTFVLDEVLNSYVLVTKDFIGNANSIHSLGVKSKELMVKATNQIANILGVNSNEIIYTSGASESNSAAIKGICYKYINRGKHIISSYAEHKSVLDTLDYLSHQGFTVSYVKLLDNGQIDLNDLYNIIREDTILITLCGVNSECGFKAPLKTIRQVMVKKKSKAFFHSDMTQALGKRTFSLSDVDAASFSAHKIYAPKGIGILYKKESLEIEPMIFGFSTNAPYRGGTPSLALIVAFSKAMRIMNDNYKDHLKYVESLNKKLIDFFKKYNIRINSYESCVPHIISISLLDIKGETFVHAMEYHNIFISTNSACSSGKESIVLKSITNDNKVSETSVRISISPYTTMNEITEFMVCFDKEYRKLVGIIK
ncbi:MAG: cysteine desulfurase family protein [Bacilli bacterium]